MRVAALSWVGLSKGAHERRGSMMVHEKANTCATRDWGTGLGLVEA